MSAEATPAPPAPHMWCVSGLFDLTAGEAKELTSDTAGVKVWLPGESAVDRPPLRNDNLRRESLFVGCFKCEQAYSDELAAKPCAGMTVPTVKFGERPGRNDKCPCGSGKKYKRCHGAEEGS